MDIIITDKQFDKLVPQEHIDFVKAWKQKTGKYPTWQVLKNSGEKVGDTLPTHPKSTIGTKAYVDNYMGKFLNGIVAKLSNESGESFTKVKGAKNYPTPDGKYMLRSELEASTYNIFWLEGLADELEVESKKLKTLCAGKEPDFVWEKRKIIIEIAGWKGPEYEEKLRNAEECFKNLGYTTFIIWDKDFYTGDRYVKYYKYLCSLMGFEPKEEVIKNPWKFLSVKELDRNEIQKFIDDNITKMPYSDLLYKKLTRYINQLYGMTLKEYKKAKGILFKTTSVDYTTIRKFKEDNPEMLAPQIAKHFGLDKKTVYRALTGKRY
jgi:hypothetical protein